MREIRRIRANEAEVVTGLWDEMARSAVDGSPLTARGRSNISGMLEAAAHHAEVVCLVAVDDTQDAPVVAFTVARTERHPLLPGTAGEIEAFYVTPSARDQGFSRRLAEAITDWLRSNGATTIIHHVCRDDTVAQTFWEHLGFDGDTVGFALYPS